nr:subtilase 1.3 [Tanacetum cinerariifolium]
MWYWNGFVEHRCQWKGTRARLPPSTGNSSWRKIRKINQAICNERSKINRKFCIFGTKVDKTVSSGSSFSFWGPNFISLEILKSDLVASGVNILAAWTGDTGPSSLKTDKRRAAFNILSGTSISCPHISGVATLLKARHSEWSPAATKSALMTTAYIHDNTYKALVDSSTGGQSSPYDHKAGHINPSRAVDPGPSLRTKISYKIDKDQVAQKKVKIAFKNADSSSRVELIPSKIKYSNKVILNFHKEFSVFSSFKEKEMMDYFKITCSSIRKKSSSKIPNVNSSQVVI